MKNHLILPLFSLLFVLVFLVSSFAPIQATTYYYYNWLKNPSFESAVNLIDDNSFESGAYNNWTHGNWTGDTSPAIYQSSVILGFGYRTGSYWLYANGVGIRAWYNLTGIYKDKYLGNEIIKCGFYANATNVAYTDYAFYYYYSDNSYTLVEVNVTRSATWNFYDMTGNITTNKYLRSLRMGSPNSGVVGIDDIVLFVDDNTGDQQSSFGINTYPWYGNDGYSGLVDNSNLARTGTGSFCFSYLDESIGATVIQDVNYLDSNSAYYLDCYANNSLGNGQESLTAMIRFQSSKIRYKEVNLTATSGYQYVFFGNFFESNDAIVEISITFNDIYPNTHNIWIDDIALWASVPMDISSFDYYYKPYAIQQFNKFSDQLAIGIVYHFYGEHYNASGVIGGNGTYIANFANGQESGNVTNGLFDFDIGGARVTQANYTELWTLTYTIDEFSKTETFSIHWLYYSAYVPPVTGGDQSGGALANWIVTFFLLFFPAIMLAYVCKEQDMSPAVGFIVGLALSTSFGYMASPTLVPLWLLFVIMICIIVMILAMLRKGGTI